MIKILNSYNNANVLSPSINSYDFTILEVAENSKLSDLITRREISISEDVNEVTFDVSDKKIANEINKPMGKYKSVVYLGISENIDKSEKYIVSSLASFIKKNVDKSTKRVLVTGLGYSGLVADSLGPATASLIKPNKNSSREIFIIKPEVYSVTGIEASDMADSIAKTMNVDLVIAVDTLSTSRVKRVGSVFQITDSGITPGSGVANSRKPLNKAFLDIPVLAIGVPMVASVRGFLTDIARNNDTFKIGEIINDLNDDLSDKLIVPYNIESIVGVCARIISKAIIEGIR